MRTMKTVMMTAVLALAAFPALAATFEIDSVHSEVSFKVRHMMMGKTGGRFGKFSGTVEYDAKNPKAWATKAVIEAASIDTDNEKRDAHLKAADFFNVEKFPTLEFSSTQVTGWKDGKGKLEGNLTMHGVTKPVVLDLELNGETEKGVGFTAKGTIDRRDFGIVWNKVIDKGGVAVGNDVAITLEIEALRK